MAKEKIDKKKVKELKIAAEEEILEQIAEPDIADDMIMSDEPYEVKTKHGPVMIKAWSFGEYAQIGPVIDAMLNDFENAKIDSTLLFVRPASLAYYENIILPMQETGQVIDAELERLYGEAVFAEQTQVTRLFARAAVYGLQIIQFACGFSDEEVRSLEADEGLGLFNVIMMKNMSVLGKAFELFGKHINV
jgi:hypothetical protein